MKIPFASFEYMHTSIKQEIMYAFEKFYDSNWYVLGDEVKNFEQLYAAFNKIDFCVGVSNGLDAIHIALKALGIGLGDEVIVPSNTYIATWLAVSYVRATPVPVEPDSETYNIDPKKIERAITNRTKAIIPVHLYGQACNMDEIIHISKKYNLFVIEDNAQSQGASFNNKLTGSFGDINATSFYPGKNLGALGDAGAITTSSEVLANKVKVLRNYGSSQKYFNDVIGYNMRLDECQAAFLSVKLAHLSKWIQQRQEIVGWYYEQLKEVKDLILPKVHPKATHVYHLYVVRTKQRDDLQKYLAEKGISTLIHYPIPPHLQKAYIELNIKKGSLPIAEELAETSLSLPLWPGLTLDQIQYISETIRSFYAKK